MSYRPVLESGALRQMQDLPEQATDMLMTLRARICDDPYAPMFSAPAGVPRRRVPDVGDFGSSYSRLTRPLAWSALSASFGQAELQSFERGQGPSKGQDDSWCFTWWSTRGRIATHNQDRKGSRPKMI